jgi:pyridoxine 5-phosphate synthase
MNTFLRLGVNIDHVATIRNARGGDHPDPVRAAKVAETFGADGITAHLREDRRHISDQDIERLIEGINIPLNLEMAATDEMLDIALRYKPHAACIVPEKREEQTTEGGLDVVGGTNHLKRHIERLSDAGIRVSLFIEPYLDQLDAAAKLGSPVVELHVGAYCDSRQVTRAHELAKIEKAVLHAHNLGLECHAGHGLTYNTVGAIAKIPNIAELNIGHFLVGEAIFVGFESAMKRMRNTMDNARIMEAL